MEGSADLKTALSNATTEQGGASVKVQAGVKWTDRPGMTLVQMIFAGVFFGVLTAFLGLGFTQTVMKKNMMYLPGPAPCPPGWSRRSSGLSVSFVSPYCLDEDLTKKWAECQGHLQPEATQLGHKEREDEEHEQEDEEKDKEDLWDVFANNAHVTAVMGPSILVASAMWFFVLKWFPLFVIYGTISVSVLFLMWMAYLVYDPAKPVAAIMMLVMAAVSVITTYMARRTIEIAGRTASAACNILKQRPTVFVACFMLKALWLGLIACWFCFNVSGALVGEVYKVGEICNLKHSDLNMLPVLSALLIFIIAFFEMGSVLICSLTMGAHFFNDETSSSYPAFTGLGWVFTSSSGAVAESAAILSLVNFGNEYLSINRKGAWACMWPCNPLWWLLKMVWFVVQKTLSAMSRFKLVMHAFHGGGLGAPGTLPLAVLQKHLGTAVVAEVVGGTVLPQSASLLATILGLGTWVWLDASEGAGLFAHVGKAASQADDIKAAQYVVVMLPLLMYLCVNYYPKFTVMAFIFLSTYRDSSEIARDKIYSTAFAGFFTGAVAVLVLRFFVDIVFHSMDGLLYAYALEAETGGSRSGLTDDIRNVIEAAKENCGEQEPLSATLTKDGATNEV